MRVRVLFFGVLKELTGRTEDTLEMPAGSTISQVFQQFANRFGTLPERRASILFARNREFATGDTAITEGDEIAFLPPVSGGSDSGAQQLFNIVQTPIDSEQLRRLVMRPEDGAVVTFEGVVRNNTRGRATAYLEYECYEMLALRQMQRIGEEIAAKLGIGRIGMVHRLGKLQIGEASVVICVSAPHRRPAFEAALEAIDRLKKEVPIWKKEFFDDGAVWVDGEWDEALLQKTFPS